MQTCYRNVIRRHFPTLHDHVHQPHRADTLTERGEAVYAYLRSEGRIVRPARKIACGQRLYSQSARFAQPVQLGAVEPARTPVPELSEYAAH